MSSLKLTKKQKKGLAFRERKDKKQSGILLEDRAIPQADLPDTEETQPNALQVEAEKSLTKTKKRKREVSEHESKSAEDHAKEGEKEFNEYPSNKKSKKPKLGEEKGKETTNTASGKARFILFVGNLKYTTSLNAIQEHFADCDPPPQVRLLTPKPKSRASSTTKSKGCAFLEFSHRNALQQGLKLHGSTLDGRRINVELTAGGGGKSEKRVDKVRARNKQLLEQRKTRVQKKGEAGNELDITLTAPPQRHSTTSGAEEIPQKKRTWTVPEAGEASGRGGIKVRGKKGKAPGKQWGTGANAVAVG